MFKSIDPPVNVPLHRDHTHPVSRSAHAGTVGDLINYLYTFDATDEIDGPGDEAEGRGVVVRRYHDPENRREYNVLDTMADAEYRQLYPRAWEDWSEEDERAAVARVEKLRERVFDEMLKRVAKGDMGNEDVQELIRIVRGAVHLSNLRWDLSRSSLLKTVYPELLQLDEGV